MGGGSPAGARRKWQEKLDGKLIMCRDGTKYSGQQLYVAYKCADGIRIVWLPDGQLYTLLPDEWELCRDVQEELAKPAPPPPAPKPMRETISICPQCRTVDSLDRSTWIFTCCSLTMASALMNVKIQQLT